MCFGNDRKVRHPSDSGTINIWLKRQKLKGLLTALSSNQIEMPQKSNWQLEIWALTRITLAVVPSEDNIFPNVLSRFYPCVFVSETFLSLNWGVLQMLTLAAFVQIFKTFISQSVSWPSILNISFTHLFYFIFSFSKSPPFSLSSPSLLPLPSLSLPPSAPLTCIGEMRAAISVKPTISEKKMVTQSYCSGTTRSPRFSWSVTDLGSILRSRFSIFLFSSLNCRVRSSTNHSSRVAYFSIMQSILSKIFVCLKSKNINK